ncbi:hypothetical protein CMALT394_200069 [Carnobacterium maltaromaticum]|nr:hypothetical protein CMALT394_200069 [Carnobacterium maltaromaticum]
MYSFKSTRKLSKNKCHTKRKYSFHPSRQPKGFISKENSYKTTIISFEKRMNY